MEKKVVITGLGVVSPIGSGVKFFQEALKKGKSGIRYFPELEKIHLGCCVGGKPEIESHPLFCMLDKYNLTDNILAIKYAVLAALEAWLDAGLNIPESDSEYVNKDTGCIISSVAGNIEIITDRIYPLVSSGDARRLGSKAMEQIQFHSPSAFLAGILALGNQTTSNSCACASSSESIIAGYERIKSGKAKRMLVGGTEGYSPYLWAVVDSARLTTRMFNDMPEKASRPMSASASGFVPGAGAGIMLLEDFEEAVKRNAKIYCEVAGGSVNNGGHRNGGSMTAPSPIGMERCILDALANSSTDKNEIDLISGHLTSTMADVIELICWSKTLGRRKEEFPYLNSLKSLAGHCMGAAGALETIAAALEIQEQFIYPNLNCEDLHPFIEKIISKVKAPDKVLENVMINNVIKANFGTGDVNACLILKKTP